MKKVKLIILGAGPTGLTVACKLLERGFTDFVVLEKEEEVGGLCRSRDVDGFPLDIGGGHFLDMKNKKASNYLFDFLPEAEWQVYDRVSNIIYKGNEIGYPFESHLWELPIEEQVEFIDSIYKAGCNNGLNKPADFESWIKWKLGDRIAEEYMLPYNRKIWSIPLDKLGTYWLHKLPNVSTKETLKSCLSKNQYGNIPAHSKFYYPKSYGYGEVWKRMGQRLKNRLVLSYNVKTLDLRELTINNQFMASLIINTIPWTVFDEISECPKTIKQQISSLKHTSIQIDYYSENYASNAHWLYVPEEKIGFHRILNRKTFVPRSRGYWTESNLKRVKQNSAYYHINKFAYPLNTIGKPESISTINKWAKSKNIYGLGRWGEWEHMNSDIAVSRALDFADEILKNERMDI